MKSYPINKTNKIVRGAKRATYDQPSVFKVLDAGFVCFVSYVFHGQAISIPMAYGRKEDTIILHGSLKNRMLSSLLKNKNASITVMHLDGLVLARSGFHHSVNYRSVTLFGTIEEVKDSIKKAEALQVVIDQMIPNRWNTLRPITEKEIKSTLVVKFTIETASVKIRDEGVVDNIEDMDFPVWAGIVPLRQVALTPEPDSKLNKAIPTPKHVTDYVNKNQTP